MEVLTLKLEESKLGLFNRVKLSLYRQKFGDKRLTPSALALLGKISSFEECRLTYEQVREEFGRARSTVANAFKELREWNLIQKIDRDQDGTAFSRVDELPGRQYDNVPQYLYTAEIRVSKETRKLKDSEIRVLARIMTECSYPKNGGNPRNGGGVYRVSNKKLARLLGLSETTVKKAIRALMRAGLVYRSAKNKGKNRYKLSGYEVARECYFYKKYTVKRKTAPEAVPNNVKNANDKADRERYYSILRNQAQVRAEQYLAQANKNERFRTVSARLRVLEKDIAIAEIRDISKIPALKRERIALRAERAKILFDMDLSEEILKPTYSCKKCNDTGFLPNGRACDCYDPGGGL